MHIRLLSRPIRCRPITCIPNDNWPELSMKSGSFMTLIGLGYSTIFLLGWNLPVPSNIERIPWRVSGVGTLSCGFLAVMIELLLFRVYLPRRKG